MSWLRITEAQILTKMTATELSSFRASDLAAGQTDPIEDAIDTVTDKVRGHVAAWHANTLGAAGTIPKELLGAALDLLVLEIQTRAGGMLIDLGDTRKTAAASAEALLGRVAVGKYAIENTDTGVTGVAAPRPHISEKTTRMDRSKQEGI
jgi:hypothetical protein